MKALGAYSDNTACFVYQERKPPVFRESERGERVCGERENEREREREDERRIEG